jgi:LysR family cyn operon transcriptional activator
MLRDAERLASSVRTIGEGQAGELRVGASMAFELSAFFAQVLAPFRRAHPRLHLSIQFGHSIRLAEAVQEQQLDLGYVLNWRLPPGATYEPLHHAEFVLMVARDHPLARKERVRAADVNAVGLITAPMYSHEWPHYDELLRASGLARYRVGLEIDGVQARLLAAQAGLGVMGVFVPPYARRQLADLLQPLRLQAPPPRAEFGLVSRAQYLQTAAAREFADWLRKRTATSDT